MHKGTVPVDVATAFATKYNLPETVVSRARDPIDPYDFWLESMRFDITMAAALQVTQLTQAILDHAKKNGIN